MKKKIFIVFVGFFFGCLFLFPWSKLQHQISGALYSKTRMVLRMNSLKIGIGFLNGFNYSSLLALKAKNFSLRLNSGQKIMCKDVSIGPNFWPLLLGQLRVNLICRQSDNSFIKTKVVASPFWGPKKASIKAELENANINKYVEINNQLRFEGSLTGQIDLEDYNINLEEDELLKNATVDLSIANLVTPELDMNAAKLPSIVASESRIVGSFDGSNLNLSPLIIGAKKDPFYANFALNIDFNANMMPQKGQWNGKVIMDKAFEAKINKGGALSLKITFGLPNANGVREFKKSFTNGQVSDLLMKKPQ